MNDRAMRFDHKLHTRLNALGEREIVPVTLPVLVFMAGRDDPKAVAEQIFTMLHEPCQLLRPHRL